MAPVVECSGALYCDALVTHRIVCREKRGLAHRGLRSKPKEYARSPVGVRARGEWQQRADSYCICPSVLAEAPSPVQSGACSAAV